MSVLLPNRFLGVRPAVPGAVDPHGEPSVASWGAMKGPLAARAEEGADVGEMAAVGGRTWVLALDPGLWPVFQGDLVVEPSSGAQWLVVTADLLMNNAAADIDYIRAEAHMRKAGSTAP